MNRPPRLEPRYPIHILTGSVGRGLSPVGPAAHELGAPTWGALVETIEAASRCGQEDLGSQAMERLISMTRASGTNWALGIEARSRALRGGAAAENAYLEAIERLKRTRIRGELARSHLLYGEWLRRHRRGIDARHRLRTARELQAAPERPASAKLRPMANSPRKRPTSSGSFAKNSPTKTSAPGSSSAPAPSNGT
jgi:hypothetical protein